jgi:Domain of unknown function (DUF4349)
MGRAIQAREPAAIAERRIAMGTTSRPIIVAGIAALLTVGALGLTACRSSNDDDTSRDAAAAATVPAGGDAASLTATPAVEREEAAAAPAASGGSVDVATMQVPGQAIAIEARATLEADDVREAVDRITSAVTTHGGRVAAADIDYAPPSEDDGAAGSRATLVLEVPPDELPAIADALEELGTVLSFDQLAEDVTDQLADLDTRIANLRASVERVRALFAEATDIDSIVRLEAELTRRETDLEVLLASQQALEDRVTMATLTVDVTASPGSLDDDDRPGIVDAAAAGWGAFVGGLFAIVLVLVAIAPFVLTVLVLAVLALWVHQLVRRRADVPPSAAVSEPTPEREPASRQG